MKKIISGFIILTVLLFIIWAMLGWVFGEASEKAFKSYTRKSVQSDSNRLTSFELLNYRRTLFGAKGDLRLIFNNALLSGRFDALPVHFTMLNGPLFATGSGIATGTSHWRFVLDDSRLSHKQRDSLQGILIDSNPEIAISMDFNHQAAYQSKINTPYARLLLTGLFDLDSEDNRGILNIDDVSIRGGGYRLTAKKMLLSFNHQKGITKLYKPGSSTITIPELQWQSATFKQPISGQLKATTKISSENNQLSGLINIEFNNKNTDDLPIKVAKIGASLNNLPQNGVISWNRVNGEIDNIKEQLAWTLEEAGEYPEGQDHIWQLYDKMKTLRQTRITLINKAFDDAKSIIHLEAGFTSPKGHSTLTASISPDVNSDKFKKTNKLLSLIKSEAQVSLADDLYTYLSEKIPLKKEQFKLVFKDNKLLIQQ